MFKFIKRLFAWWDGYTLGTKLAVWRRAEFVFQDEFGNRYYEEKKATYDGRKRRWVTYKGYADGSKVPPEWHAWLHHTTDERPCDAPQPVPCYEKPYQPNLTGTPWAWRPKGSLWRGGKRPKTSADYEAWTPDA